MAAGSSSGKGTFKIIDNYVEFLPFYSRRVSSHKVKIQGRWSIDKACNLVFQAASSYNLKFGRTLFFDAKVVKASARSIEFKVLKRTTPLLRKINRIVLKGRWKVVNNRLLAFEVRKEKSTRGLLLFKGRWDITDNNQIVYFYSRRDLKTRLKSVHSFLLKGRWFLGGKRLYYMLSGTDFKKNSLSFEFSPLPGKIKAGADKLVFSLTSLGDKKPAKNIVLRGEWAVKNSTQVIFVLKGISGQNFSFSLAKSFGRGNNLVFSLKKKQSRQVFEVEFSKSFAQGDFFAKLSRMRKSLGLDIGLDFKF